jgi:hypothetical protein
MKTIFVLLVLFLGIGLFVRSYNKWTRLLLITVIAGVIAYLYVA